ncbi:MULTISPECIES: YicC/YloC family endoribonuclease [unclassified Brevundimonas]|uniref:YicC/YloC family endoribonuclease n=1 Tax=unclassified Brevundimonas TaxID=2622653 RepID=UPI0025BA73AC|nr:MULTISPECIES: YicC/YloC family endoribonuclease [unclassified Brevundimonas]
MAAISGMTGFGRADGALHGWSWTVEARSVNGRSLEVRYRGPQGFETLERAAKTAAQSRLHRGQVTLGLQARRDGAGEGAIKINTDILGRYTVLARDLMAQGMAAATADGILALRGVIEASEEAEDADARAEVEAAMALSIEAALDALKASRQHEGAQLFPVVSGFVDQIEALVIKAGDEAEAQVQTIRDRFNRRIRELAPEAEGLEERIFLEAAALATKADVREELDRLTAHIASARGLLASAPAGRKLDFLMQEFMREANTLCSKSATTELTAIGLELKAVIEQLREQVQNVE